MYKEKGGRLSVIDTKGFEKENVCVKEKNSDNLNVKNRERETKAKTANV